MKIRAHVKEKDIYMGITHIRVIPSQFWNLPFSPHCSCLFARSNFSEWKHDDSIGVQINSNWL